MAKNLFNSTLLHSTIPKDFIYLKRIAIYAYHGVYEEEEKLGQRFFLSLKAYLDLKEAGEKDDIAYSISYADLAEYAQEIAVSNRFNTIEALAETIANNILERFHKIEAIEITVEKPHAPVPILMDSLMINIFRVRKS